MIFWKKYSQNRKFNIKDFRDTKSNNIFTSWSPYINGLSYYNFYIYKYVLNNQKKFFKFKSKTKNLNLGNPPYININNKHKVCLDECVTFEEIEFLKKILGRKKDLNILEIGAGYGRLTESLIKSFKIQSYTIIDYKNIIKFAKKYLFKTLKNSEFKRIKFIEYEKFNFDDKLFKNKIFDTTINIDSFGEIEPHIVKKYLKFINKYSKSFYTKNTVDKYYPKDMINHLSKKRAPKYIMKLGLNRKLINIFNKKQLEKSKIRYLNNYNPFNKKKHKKKFFEFSTVIHYYLHAFFIKN